MSRVLPILFNTEMVRAILDGRKTVTRRVVKLPKSIKAQDDGLYTLLAEGTCYENQHMEELVDYLKPPYQPGDILYVRECGIIQSMKNFDKTVKMYFPADDTLIEFKVTPDEYERLSRFPEDKKLSPYWLTKQESRIWLKVKDVRVERLHEITPDQICREGIEVEYPHILNGEEKIYAFSQLWNSTIKKYDLDRYGWDANSFIWVIEFERCEKPEG